MVEEEGLHIAAVKGLEGACWSRPAVMACKGSVSISFESRATRTKRPVRGLDVFDLLMYLSRSKQNFGALAWKRKKRSRP